MASEGDVDSDACGPDEISTVGEIPENDRVRYSPDPDVPLPQQLSLLKSRYYESVKSWQETNERLRRKVVKEQKAVAKFRRQDKFEFKEAVEQKAGVASTRLEDAEKTLKNLGARLEIAECREKELKARLHPQDTEEVAVNTSVTQMV